MPLAIGTRVGPYEVTGPLGAGGMGEVYRARDTRLNRDVALKILPAVVSDDADSLARFRREAQLLASLNHPNIATIHGFEESNGTRALVLELVDGPTLADRIAAGPIPLDEASAIARQIADALAAAHDQGIVHRDLKPSNVKLRSDGAVKVLDFGLAKALAPPSVDVSTTPTITSPAATALGVVLGTAAYMSPEQARGHAVTTSADIWAFGCVLFEMLTGARPFAGDDTAEVIAAIMRGEPEWPRLPAGTPENVRRLLRRCLQKDPKRRLADIRDARLELDEIEAPADRSTTRGATRRERALWSAAVALLALMTVVGVARRFGGETSAPLPEMRVEITTPPTTDPLSIAISPDGNKIVFAASENSRPQLWLRMLDSTAPARPLRGTDGASFPFWSPDSRLVGFFTNEKLYRIDIEGGVPRLITSAIVATGGTWNRDGTIVFTPVPDAPLLRVSAEGGEPRPVRAPPSRGDALQLGTGSSSSRGEPGQRFPFFLPDGRHFLYYVAETRGVFLSDLEGAEPRRLFDADGAAVVAPPAELLFVRDGRLFSQRFDPASLQLSGEPSALASGITIDQRGGAAVSASSVGSVAYRTGAVTQARRLLWLDRSGKEISGSAIDDAGNPVNVSLSPDGRRIAFNRSVEGNTDIWVLDVMRNVPSRFTFERVPEIVPVWSPDGARIMYAKVSIERGGFGLFAKAATNSGSEEIVFQNTLPAIPLDWSRDGRYVLFRTRDPQRGWDIWAQALQGDKTPFAVARSNFDERTAQFSPDGKWIAYESNESGRFEIYVQPFPSGSAKLRVSADGAATARSCFTSQPTVTSLRYRFASPPRARPSTLARRSLCSPHVWRAPSRAASATRIRCLPMDSVSS